jgi:glycosyltransferase involved in cell wall biosynthesis
MEMLEKYRNEDRVRVIALVGNSGTAVRARNTGICEAVGSYIAFLDSDDLMDPMRLAWSVAPMEVFGFGVTHGHWRAIVDGSRSVAGLTDGQYVKSGFTSKRALLSSSILCQSTVTVRADLFERVGLLKPEIRYREDHELWLRLAHYRATFFLVNRCLVRLRLHSRNNELNFIADSERWRDLVVESYLKKGPDKKLWKSSSLHSWKNDSQS